MAFGNVPKDAGGIPIGGLYTPNVGFAAFQAGTQQTDGSGNVYAPAETHLADGAQVTLGAKADAAQTDVTQTTSTHSFIKGIVKILADMWDGTNHWLQVKVMNGNANGQATMANSAPVVIASDQTQMATSDTLNASGSQEFTIGLLRSNFTQLARMCDASSQGDGTTAPFQFPGVVPYLYNGASIDFQRGNMDNITLINASSVSTTQTSADQKNFNARGVKIFINITTHGGAAITFTLQGKDPVSGTYYTILASAALNANAFTVLTVYPGAVVTANVSANDVVPRTWNLVATGASAATFTVAYAAIV